MWQSELVTLPHFVVWHNCVAEQAHCTAGQAMSVAENTGCQTTSEADAPAMQIDRDFLQGLRGQRNEDAVMNLFLNRVLDPNAVEGTLLEMEKYFENDLPEIGSFLSMKFGIRACSWVDLRSSLISEASSSSTWQNGCTLGMVLKDMRKQRSNNRVNSAERARHLTDELVKPRRKERHK